MIRGPIHQEEIRIPNLYATDCKASSYVKPIDRIKRGN